jgi:hypothetical protein
MDDLDAGFGMDAPESLDDAEEAQLAELEPRGILDLTFAHDDVELAIDLPYPHGSTIAAVRPRLRSRVAALAIWVLADGVAYVDELSIEALPDAAPSFGRSSG